MIQQLLSRLASNAEVENLVKWSIKDYHIKGFDYICLHRSTDLTVKLYFFDGDISNMSEVVNPHDHRYDFDTHVLAGQFTDFTFKESPEGRVFQQFEYRTPLLGGNGFTWHSEAQLEMIHENTAARGQAMSHDANDFHTIRIDKTDTVLCLLQYADKPGIDATWTFTQDREPPNLDGLYTEFTTDQVLNRLKSIQLIE